MRARRHAALGDPHRLAVVDALRIGDRTSRELGSIVDIPSNLLAHHLEVLEKADLIERRPSEGDARRSYVVLRRATTAGLGAPPVEARAVLFVCTHNSARSLFAEAFFRQTSSTPVDSAGTDPTSRGHPHAVRVAAEMGIDLSAAVPKGYESIGHSPDIVVSVCDRARESETLPPARRHIHWSIPDPVRVPKLATFRKAFSEIAERVEDLALALEEGVSSTERRL